MKFISVLIAVVLITIFGIVGYNVTHETIDAGYVGYIYDRNADENDNVIPNTSVIFEERTGRVTINPITQEVIAHPITELSFSFTRPEEGDWGGEDMSITVTTKEGELVDTDVYFSIRFTDIPKIIQCFGTKKHEDIVFNDIFAIIRTNLSTETQDCSVYDLPSSSNEISAAAKKVISENLMTSYGIELCQFGVVFADPSEEIQAKIAEKTAALNAVEMAKLERQRQEEVNQQTLDQQRTQSEKEKIQRQAKADADAYEKQKEAEALLAVSESNVEIARQELEIAKLEKEAVLERQKVYTEEYFRDKELDVQKEAVRAINSSVKTIITSGEGEGYSGLAGVKEVLDSLEG